MTSGGGKGLESFKEHMAKEKAQRSTRTVFYHFDTSDRVAEVVISLLLNEAKPYVDLGKGRAIRHHKTHIPDTQDHLHFLVKRTNIAAINKDGSAHDRSHGVQLQKWATDGAKKNFPDFHIPDDGLLESLFAEDAVLLSEAQDHGNVLLPAEVQAIAESTVL